jgi:hypothetical protein
MFQRVVLFLVLPYCVTTLCHAAISPANVESPTTQGTGHRLAPSDTIITTPRFLEWWQLALLVMGDLDVNGNMCIEGWAHINGHADFGPDDAHLYCGDYTSGCCVYPAPVFTDPDGFPEATYYFVRGHSIGEIHQARIFDRYGSDITTAIGDSMDSGQVSWDPADSSYTFLFEYSDVRKYFNDTTGVFERNVGDRAVVINFGESMGLPPKIKSHLIFKGDEPIWPTIINTRFTGITEEDRLNDHFWYGGRTELQNATFEPRHGIALIPYDIDKIGSTLVQIGTPNWPALIYVTNDVGTINANYEGVGGTIVVGDFGVPHVTGGPDLMYDARYLLNLPGYLVPSDVHEDEGARPRQMTRVTLDRTMPNPFRGVVRIAWTLMRASRVNLTVHDVVGRRMAGLVSGWQDVGSYSIRWTGVDDRGKRVGSGVYFVRLEAGVSRHSVKIVILD